MEPNPKSGQHLSKNLFKTMAGSNIIGAALCTFYFIFLDQVELPQSMGRDIYVSLVMTLVLIGVGSFLSRRWEKGLMDVEQMIRRGETPDPEMLAKAQPRYCRPPFSLPAWPCSTGCWPPVSWRFT